MALSDLPRLGTDAPPRHSDEASRPARHTLRIDLASFNLGLRTKGASGKDAIVIGMLADSADRVTRFSYESEPGDVLVTPPGTEHENRYYGGSSVIIASILTDDIHSSFASEGALSDPAAWRNPYPVRAVGSARLR